MIKTELINTTDKTSASQGRMQDFSGGGGPILKFLGFWMRHVASSEATSLC